MKKNLKRILAAAAFALLVAVMAFVYVRFSAKPVAGSKAITITVVNSAAKETAYALKTDAEYLDQAMKEAEGLTFSGEQQMQETLNTTVWENCAEIKTMVVSHDYEPICPVFPVL